MNANPPCPRCGKPVEGVACPCRSPVSDEQRARAKKALQDYLARRRPRWAAAHSLPGREGCP